MPSKPFPQSFWVHENLLCAGCYPGDLDPETRDAKLRGLLDCGIRRVLSLMEPQEKSRDGRPFEPYVPRLQAFAAERGHGVECLNFPIRDTSAPTLPILLSILDVIDEGLGQRTPTYVHCWGGHGRTSTVVICHLIRTGRSEQEAKNEVLRLRATLPKSHYPLEGDQEQFIKSWAGGSSGN